VHETRERLLGLLRDLAGGVAGNAGELGADDPQVLQVGGVRRALHSCGQQRRPPCEQFVDQGPLVIQLRAYRVTLGRGDRDRLVEAPLGRHHIPAVEQGVGGVAENLGAGRRVSLHAVEFQHRVLDVALDERALPCGDVDDEGGRPLPARGPRVVADHSADERDEQRHHRDDVPVAPGRGSDPFGRRGGAHEPDPLTTSNDVCIPPR
jgi:hypothetical protein